MFTKNKLQMDSLSEAVKQVIEKTELDELSKKTLNHYSVAALNRLSSDRFDQGKADANVQDGKLRSSSPTIGPGYVASQEKLRTQLNKSSDKRKTGIQKAITRLSKEETTFVDRLLQSIKEGKGNQPKETFTDNNMGEEMSSAQMKKREKYVMSMKDKTAEFKAKYGKDWKNVMYATATKMAMQEEIIYEAEDEHEYHLYYSGKHPNAGMRVNKTVYKNLKSVSRAADKLDSEYGSYAHSYKKIKKSVKEETIYEAEVVAKASDPEEVTTDMLTGREKGGKTNSFKPFKLQLRTDGEMKAPEMEKGVDTKEKQKITTNPGAVDIKLDDKLTGPTPHTHFSSEKSITSESVRGMLKRIRSKEKSLQNKEIKDFSKKVVESEENEYFEINEEKPDHTHVAHFENKDGEWMAKLLINADHDGHAIDQANEASGKGPFGGLNVRKVERVTKVMEEVEELDELSKNTLSSYAKKVLPNVLAGQYHRGRKDKEASSRPGGFNPFDPKSNKRMRGLEKAVGRLAKEETELDEAMDTRSDVPAYLRKARGDKPLSHDEVGAKKHDTRSAPGNVKMSPLERVRGLADLSMKRMKKENLIGSAGATSESFEEEVENINEESLLDKYISSMGMDPDHVPRAKKIGIARSASFLAWLKRFK